MSHIPLRARIYFTLVRLADGDLASLTVIREQQEFYAQLRSYGFEEFAGASSLALEAMSTGAFLKAVEGVFSVSRGRPYTYLPPDGMNWPDWYDGMEERARDPRFAVVERDGAMVYNMIALAGLR